ncbi:MAG: response regulator [Pseudobdellovibrionaceae bacterium]|nr:response regulator [Pseudobdellovibrionaceae bacterium]
MQEADLRGSESSKILYGIKVLVVDDIEDSRNILAQILGFSGANVRTEESVDKALAAIDEFNPDVLVSDISMPEKDGYELIRALREDIETCESHKTPAIAVSALGHPSYKERALSAGFQVYLSKPVNMKILVKLVEVLAELDGNAVAYGFDPSVDLSNRG